MQIKIKKLYADAVIPTRAYDGDAGLDLHAYWPRSSYEDNLIKKGYQISRGVEDYSFLTVGTGLAVEIPKGYVGLVYPRSSLCKKGIGLANSVGVVDSGYRGEIKVWVHRLWAGERSFAERIPHGERIAQLVIQKIPVVEILEVEELSESERGEGGFGSSGS